jgi:site-specific DNA recombinase
MKAAIYARYSSNLQRGESLEDQLEVCRRYIVANGWSLTKIYSDAAISGASRQRPGFLSLLHDASQRVFDVVVCEAVDRLGRRLADTADLHDQLSFRSIGLHAASLGEITAIHVGVMGMMAQMALKELGEKTKRGQLGRILKGKAAGGLGYGYQASAGPTRGDRLVIELEAEIVRRIFKEYGDGRSPEAIAKRLNEDCIPGPGGRSWSNTTIRGQAARGTGVLNNELYRGVLVWNRCSYVKDPQRGKRVARPNPPEQHEISEVPHLRIVDDASWIRAKARQVQIKKAMAAATLKSPGPGLHATHHVRFLLSGLLQCGVCGGGYTIVGRDRYGCATRRQKGMCQNSRTVTRQEIESRVLSGLKGRLLAPELVEEFVREFNAELERHRRASRGQSVARARKVTEVDRKIGAILKAVEDGMYHSALKDRMAQLEAERASLAQQTADPIEDVTLLVHPNVPELYRRKVTQLEELLERGEDRDEARELIRSMIDRVVLSPRASGGLEAVLHGELGAILAICAAAAGKPPTATDPASQLSVVAGTGFEPVTFRL